MKKALKITGRIMLGLLILFVMFLTVICIWNRIAMSREKDIVKDTPGQFVEIDGHNMSIYTEGEGDHTIVFMSGWGTPSPIYDFKPLYNELSDEYRCVVIEKFGYGFSDEINGERDFDTILREDREALSKLGIEAPYILCPHSLSGLEATLWAQKYPEEVEAIVGLDMSPANYPRLAELKDSFAQKLMIRLNDVGEFVGINRFLMAISTFDGLSDDEIEHYTAVACKNLGSETVKHENDAIGNVCDEINASPLPDTPTLQYLSGDNKDDSAWKDSHSQLVAASSYGQLVQLDCGHYVHQFESERISREMKDFINGLDT